ncbi:MAG: histidinol-phosphate transaminase [Bdellovibrionales bacterium]|nr:histidinol-phosphate transaminase [Bdellovibrionales bacterium]
MIDLVQRLVRPVIANLKPYSSARSLESSRQIMLDANESPWNLQSRYPEPQPRELKRRLSELYDVKFDEVLVTRGSDEAVDVLVRTFCEPGQSSIIVHPPTFEIFAHAATIQGARVLSVPLDDQFDLNCERLLETADRDDLRLVFLCSPNNPTGSCLSTDRIERVLRGVGERALVIVDEAYIEFSRRESWTKRLSEFRQLVVLRTLSKFWGGAGLRCGVAIAHPDILEQMRKVLAPYPIAEVVSRLAVSHLEIKPPPLTDLFEARKKLALALKEISFVERVWPSDANFLFVTVQDATWVYNELLAEGIRVRNRSHLWPNSLRIGLGTKEENQEVLRALPKLQEKWNHCAKGSL